MNFYIGNSIDEINEQDVNVEFCDELIDFIYKMSGQVSFDMIDIVHSFFCLGFTG